MKGEPMDKIEKCIDEVVNVTWRDMEMMTDVIADKYNIPIKERYKVQRGVIEDFVTYGKLAIKILDTIKEIQENDN